MTMTDPATMPAEEVNREVAERLGWTNIVMCECKLSYKGQSPHRSDKNPDTPAGTKHIPDACSKDAPHSLIVAMVEAVIKAGKMNEFFTYWYNTPLTEMEEAVDDLEYGRRIREDYIGRGFALGLVCPPETIARAFIAAMRSGEGEK